MNENKELVKYEYGAMSSRFEVTAPNKLTAYSVMVLHYNAQPHLVAIYEPEESKEDSWLTFSGDVSERLHEVFGGKAGEPNAFEAYLSANAAEIRTAYDTRKRLV